MGRSLRPMNSAEQFLEGSARFDGGAADLLGGCEHRTVSQNARPEVSQRVRDAMVRLARSTVMTEANRWFCRRDRVERFTIMPRTRAMFGLREDVTCGMGGT